MNNMVHIPSYFLDKSAMKIKSMNRQNDGYRNGRRKGKRERRLSNSILLIHSFYS